MSYRDADVYTLCKIHSKYSSQNKSHREYYMEHYTEQKQACIRINTEK